MNINGAVAERPVLLLVAWGRSPAKRWAAQLEAAGFAVTVEDRDGARAYRWAREHQPAAIIIDGSTLPSHGRATAGALLQAPTTRDLPLIYTNIAAGDREKLTAATVARALALLAAPTDVEEVLDLLAALVSKRSCAQTPYPVPLVAQERLGL